MRSYLLGTSKCLICLLCQHPNPTSVAYCEKCDNELGFVSPSAWPVDNKESTEIDPESTLNANKSDETRNQAIPFSVFVRPSMQAKQSLKLVDKDHYVIAIPENGGVIGRMGNIDEQYFNSHKRFEVVSRTHASIRLLPNGKYVLKDEGSSHGTKLNGEKLEKGKEYPIKSGDTVVFSDCWFRIE